MIDLTTISNSLRLDDSGIWITTTSMPQISYPEGGSQECREVEDSSFWFRHRNACLIEILRAYPPVGTLFDVGGGNGFVCRGFERAGFPTVLVEPARAGAENAHAVGVKSVVCSTLEAANFLDNSLPAAGLFDVLEHIENYQQWLSEIHRVLVNGARLYITVPAHSCLWSDMDRYSGHYRRYTLATLTRDLQAMGFEPEYATYLFASMVPPLFLLRTLPTLMRSSRSLQAEAPKLHSPGGIMAKIIERVLQIELDWLRSGRRLVIGTSCLMVARKFKR